MLYLLPMTSVDYEIFDFTRFDTIQTAHISALESVARIDERLRHSHLAAGLAERVLFQEAQACQLAEGDLVHLVDLVPLAALVYSGNVTSPLANAVETLRTWEKALRGDAAEFLRFERPGISPKEPEPPLKAAMTAINIREIVPSTQTNSDSLKVWRRVVRGSASLPPLLAAGIAWDAWLCLLPEPLGAWRAPLLAALVLRARGMTREFLLPIDWGRSESTYRRHPEHGPEARIAGFLEWVSQAASLLGKEHNRLAVNERLVRRNIVGRRRSSRAGDLVDLLVARPVVTADMIRKELRVSKQAVTGLVAALGSVPQEISGRRRYRAWTLV